MRFRGEPNSNPLDGHRASVKPVEIPTDNLYKFMAVSGVVTALVCGYLLVSVATRHQEKLYEHFVAYEIQIIELEGFSQDVEEFGEHVERLEKLLDSKAPPGETVPLESLTPHQREALQTLLNPDPNTAGSWAGFQEQYRRLQKDVRIGDLEHKQLRSTGTRLRILTSILAVGVGGGLVVATWGFLLWYTRVQRHLDRQLASAHEQAL